MTYKPREVPEPNELIDGLTPEEHRNYVIVEQSLKISQLAGTVYKLRKEVDRLTEINNSLRDKLEFYEKPLTDDFQVTD